MICEKCGKNNRTGAERCASCGAEMPTVPYGTGFADILSFSRQQSGGPAEAAVQASAAEVQELKKRLGESKERVHRQAIRLRIVTILAVLFLILSVILTVGLLKKSGTEKQRDTNPDSAVTDPLDKPDDNKPADDDPLTIPEDDKPGEDTTDESNKPDPDDESNDKPTGNTDQSKDTVDKINPGDTNPTMPEDLPPNPGEGQEQTPEDPSTPEKPNSDVNDTNIV